MGRIGCAALVVAILVVGAGAGNLLWLSEQYKKPGPLAGEATVIVPKGAGVRAIAEQLADAGVIASPLVFRLGVRIQEAESDLRAGEYAFPAAISARDVVALLKSGKTVVRRLTVPEGLTTAQVLELVAETPALTGETGPPPGEGTLLPETYHFSYGDARAAVIARMRDAMKAELDALWATRASGLPLETPEQAVILASIIEKETAVPEERRRVAAVFVNRLRKGMLLQSDPTTIYSLTGGVGPLDRPLTRKDLATASPYNTYVSPGLPPGPIANPGRDSLAAALNPLDSEEFYFVADGAGGHAFARTLDEHERNVARWRRIKNRP